MRRGIISKTQEIRKNKIYWRWRVKIDAQAHARPHTKRKKERKKETQNNKNNNKTWNNAMTTKTFFF